MSTRQTLKSDPKTLTLLLNNRPLVNSFSSDGKRPPLNRYTFMYWRASTATSLTGVTGLLKVSPTRTSAKASGAI